MKTKIEIIMEQKGFSKSKLSRDSKVALSYLHEILKRKKSPTMRTLEKLAKALGVSIVDLLDDKKAG